ncbi:MAG: hypothetical protein KDB27_14630 [Planctomycetales bacterium]|nr:hypothetical protein [Planctomycetales bacterium]
MPIANDRSLSFVAPALKSLVPTRSNWFEAGAVGDQLSFKFWRDGDSEPSAPQLTVYDAELASGMLGLGADISNLSPTAELIDATFDDISFTPEVAIVAPPGLERTFGSVRGNAPSEPVRVQYLYPSSYFESLAGPTEITSIAWRPDESTGPLTAATESFVLRLSTTEATNLDLEFAQNIGSDVTTVFDGPVTVSIAGNAAAREFDVSVELSNPFYYDPAQGNLLVDLVTTGFESEPWWVDNELVDPGGPFLVQTFQGNDPTSEIADGAYNGLAALKFMFSPSIPGDYNNDGRLDGLDLDLQAVQMMSGDPIRRFDENNDGAVDQMDRLVWVRDYASTWMGDSNLDGEFNSSDFVDVFKTGEYEDGVEKNSTWATGDWNGDLEFTSADFIVAFQDGGFEQGQRNASRVVPEPSCCLWLVLCTIAFWRRNNC